MGIDDKIKKGNLIRRTGLAAMIAGFGIFGYSMYQVSENSAPFIKKAEIQQQAFECVEKGTTYDEATKVATMPEECYTKLQEYKAYCEKPETKEAIENIEMYRSPLIQYGSMGLIIMGMIVNITGKVKTAKALAEKQREQENEDDED